MAVVTYVRLVQRGFETSCHPETRVWRLLVETNPGDQRGSASWRLVHLHRSSS
jgi:hypothetical protein